MTRYCKCGQKLWVDFYWNGKEWTPIYYDEVVEGVLRQVVCHCPKCGEWLVLEKLTKLPENLGRAFLDWCEVYPNLLDV